MAKELETPLQPLYAQVFRAARADHSTQYNRQMTATTQDGILSEVVAARKEGACISVETHETKILSEVTYSAEFTEPHQEGYSLYRTKQHIGSKAMQCTRITHYDTTGTVLVTSTTEQFAIASFVYDSAAKQITGIAVTAS